VFPRATHNRRKLEALISCVSARRIPEIMTRNYQHEVPELTFSALPYMDGLY
jgi:hypothetical protein